MDVWGFLFLFSFMILTVFLDQVLQYFEMCKISGDIVTTIFCQMPGKEGFDFLGAYLTLFSVKICFGYYLSVFYVLFLSVINLDLKWILVELAWIFVLLITLFLTMRFIVKSYKNLARYFFPEFYREY